MFPKDKGAPAENDRTAAGVAPEPARSRADFIAAARRAAQAAHADQANPVMARPKIPANELKELASPPSLIAQTRDFLFNHKRQLTLSIAALFLVVGAYAVVRTMAHSTNHDLSLNAANTAIHDTADASPPRGTAPRKVEDVSSAMPQPAPMDKIAPHSDDGLPAPPASSTRSEAAPLPNLPLMAAGTKAPAQKSIAGSDPIVTGAINAPKNTNASAPLPETPAATLALREQAEAGNAAAQYELATRYGEGRLMPHDIKLAADWYEKAAMRGLAPAQYRLGSLYEKGMGVARDLARARDWYEKAANQGHSHAMHNLAVLIAEGANGKPDYPGAALWFRRAAELGIRDSQYNLAILYARGLGVPQDLVQSYMWFAVAAAQGDDDAGKKREDVASKLDPNALAKAKAGADSFHPREPDRAANEVQTPPGGWETAPPQTTAKGVKAKVSRL